MKCLLWLENSGSFKHDYKQINTLSKGHLKKNFYNNDKENGNDNDNNNTNDYDDIDNNNVNLNFSNNDNDNKPYLPRVRSRWIYLRTLIFRPITLNYLLGCLWNIRPKEVVKILNIRKQGFLQGYLNSKLKKGRRGWDSNPRMQSTLD